MLEKMQALKLEPEVELPGLEIDAISRTTLALFAGASGDHHPIHIDIDYARAGGFDDVFAHGMLVMAYLGRALTEALPAEHLRRFQSRFIAITHLGEKLTCSGRVRELIDFQGEPCALLEVEVQNSAGEVKITGSAIVAIN